MPIYTCTSVKNINKIRLLQKKVIRSVCKANYTAHTEPLFNDVNILPLDKLIVYNNGLLIHSIVHEYSPPALHNQWEFNRDRNRVAMRNDNDIYIPLVLTDYIKKMPYFSLASTWNNLPIEKLYPNRTTFRIALLENLKNN
jgi:hypothetical protein